MVAAQFEKVDGTEQLPIQTIIANLDELTPGAGTLAPSIMRWTGSSYVTYYYLANAEDGDGEPVENVWARNGEMTTDKLNMADGFFFKSPEACSITVAGQVVAAGQKQVTIKPNVWNLIANPYPIALKLNGPQVDWINTFTPGSGTTAPSIMRWTGSSYVTYYYLLNAEDGDGEPVHNVWARNGEMTEDSIDAARGFFIMFSGVENKTITFNK